MAILAHTKYIINCTFFEELHEGEPPIYIGTVEELKRTIAATWSQIPHRVVISTNAVMVMSNEEHARALATFVFTDVMRKQLPDHF